MTKKAEEIFVPVADEGEPSPVAKSPAEQAAGFARLAIEALGQSRSTKYAEEYAHIAGKLAWCANELEQRL